MIGKLPNWLVIQLLEKCNLRCKMCYEWGESGPYKERKELATLSKDVLSKLIRECSEIKPYYDFFGGEPLLYPWLAEILEEIRYYGSVADIPTNGTLLKSQAAMLVNTQPNRIWVSLDGPKEVNDGQRGKGVYDKAVEGLETIFQLRESKGQKNPKIGVSFIVTPSNYMYIEELFTKKLDLTHLDHISVEAQLFSSREQCDAYANVLKENFGVEKATYAYGMYWDKAAFSGIDIRELTRQIRVVQQLCKENNIFLITYPRTIEEDNLKHYFAGEFGEMVDKKKRCELPWMYVEITARGDVAPCHTYYDLTFGNINEQSLTDIWNSEKYKQYRTYMKRNMLPICTACSRYYAYNHKSEIIT